MSPEISVIIPVFNVEKELSRCIGSLISQTFTNWEAICIDDGSTDGCPSILDSFAAGDSRIKVIHKANGGVSRARNTALPMARGKYLMFVDSDDYIHPQTMEICHHMAEKDESDLVAFTYNRALRAAYSALHVLHIPEPARLPLRKYDIGKIKSKLTDDIYLWATERSDAKGIHPSKWAIKHCQPWRCMYRTERVQDILFTEGIIYEDFPWWSEVLVRTRKASIINLPLYNYYPNFRSYIMSSKQQFRIESLKTAIAEAKKVYDKAMVSSSRKRLWEENFLRPFEAKLEKKQKRFGD